MTDAPAAPPLPDWCFQEDREDAEDDEGNPTDQGANGHHQEAPGGSGDGGGGGDHQDSDGRGGRRREHFKRNPTFMPGVPGVTPVTEQPLLGQIQRRVQDMCGWRK